MGLFNQSLKIFNGLVTRIHLVKPAALCLF